MGYCANIEEYCPEKYILYCTSLLISCLLACKYSFTRDLSSAYQSLRKKNGMQYRSRCNNFSSFEHSTF